MVTGRDDIPVMSRERFELRQKRATSDVQELWNLLDRVKDPEVPVLSLWDLGVLRDIERQGERVVVTITPTYTGCPALETMRAEIAAVLREADIEEFEVRVRLAPAWSSAWLSPEGSKQLRVYGIAPPGDGLPDSAGLTPASGVACPRCASSDTRLVSEFGSTACKALFQCNRCGEPFDYFKAI